MAVRVVGGSAGYLAGAVRGRTPCCSLCHHTSLSCAAELGIDIPAIISRTRSILLLRLAGHDMDNLDLGGPLIFMAILGLSHLLVGADCQSRCMGACIRPAAAVVVGWAGGHPPPGQAGVGSGAAGRHHPGWRGGLRRQTG